VFPKSVHEGGTQGLELGSPQAPSQQRECAGPWPPGRGNVLHFPRESESLPTCSVSARKAPVHAINHWTEVEAVSLRILGRGPAVLVCGGVSPLIPPVPAGHRGVWPPSP
jgi:hypothetical protein